MKKNHIGVDDSTLNLYDVSVPALLGGFRTLSWLLDKADEFVVQGKLEESAMLDARLADDMDSFRRQIQHASDTAKAASMRLAGRSVPSLEDTETTLQELRERIGKTEDILRMLSPADFVGSEDRTIKLNLCRRWVTFDGRAYLVEYALPNFFFHVTTTYAILRSQGVQIGKLDYLVEVAQRRKGMADQSVPVKPPHAISLTSKEFHHDD